MFAPSQWETSLQSNAITRWLGANLGSALDNKGPQIASAQCLIDVEQGFYYQSGNRKPVDLTWNLNPHSHINHICYNIYVFDYLSVTCPCLVSVGMVRNTLTEICLRFASIVFEGLQSYLIAVVPLNVLIEFHIRYKYDYSCVLILYISCMPKYRCCLDMNIISCDRNIL